MTELVLTTWPTKLSVRSCRARKIMRMHMRLPLVKISEEIGHEDVLDSPGSIYRIV
jgi:hypothetical protein